jgi:serine/threonine-protein kinase
LQACEAIAEAHELGIVHRDLKPANLFRVRRADGRFSIKVLDFGISKVSAVGGSGSSMSMTGTAALMGTPLYMSPEQMSSSRGVDSRADIWALGVILFELLTGQVPFFGEHLPEVCVKIATHSPPPVRSLRTDVPAGIEAAIFKCLEKDRSKRYATVAEFCAAITPFGIPHSTASAPRNARLPFVPGQSDTLAAPISLHDAPGWRRTQSAESIGALGHTKAAATRRLTAAYGLAGAGVALVGTVAALLLFRTEKPPPATAATPIPSSSQVVGSASVTVLLAARPDPSPTVLSLPALGRAVDLSADPSARDASAPAQPAKPATATLRAVLPPADATRRPTPAQAPQTPVHAEPSKGSAAYDERL